MTVPTPSTDAHGSAPMRPDEAFWTGPVLTESEGERLTMPDEGLAPDDDRLRAGAVLDGRYEIGELLGQGGMGYVVAARHVVLGKRVAIKVLRPELTAEPEMAERFRIEARAASSIGHPNIVDVSDFGELPEGPRSARASYFVMEHLEGESLAARIEREGALRIASATDIARQMASGLHAAHAAGIVHRDVKPENVILTTRAGRLDHVKLLDFGIAKLESSRRDTGRSLVLGTPAYMSPEQARGQSLDARADVYSLGVVLFELLTGQLPFDDAHPLLVVRRHATEPVPPIRQLREDIPIPLAELVTEMLAKRPEERPSSMGEVSERLAPWASTSHVVVTRPSPMPLVIPAAPSAATARGPDFSRPTPARADTPTKTAPPARRLRGEWIGALGLVLVGTIVGAIVAGFLARRSEGPRVAPAAESPPIATPSVPAERVAPPPTSPPATLVSAPPSSPSVPPIPLRHAGSAHAAAPPSEAPAAPTEPAVETPRPPTFGEQNLLDPWE